MTSMHHTTQSTHLRVIIFLSKQLKLFSCTCMPQSSQSLAFDAFDFMKPVLSIFIYNEI